MTKITSSSTAEYFSKNLQQVGFSSHIKAVLTVLKESVDNSLDACEENGILPDLKVTIEKLGPGTMTGSDQIRIRVEDNGPGINEDDITKVFGEYLSSSKFGRGRCTRGQQGIGISACVTWAQLTNAAGVRVITKRKGKKAIKCIAEVDIKNNKGILKEKEVYDWDKLHGTIVEFVIDGRIQANGEIGLINYLNGTAIVNPHMSLTYNIHGFERATMARVTTEMPEIPEAVEPHPHTMKLGEFIQLSHSYGKNKVSDWLKNGFSRINDSVLKDLGKKGLSSFMNRNADTLKEDEIKNLFKGIQECKLLPPVTKSVISIGEESFSKSIKRLGNIDFFEIISRNPCVCDFKPVLVEVAVARTTDKTEQDSPAQILRFANRVPLQFDRSSCAIVKAVESVNWKAYGIIQSKNSVPTGPYIIAVSVVSPFIKFKNASKETIDASEELVEEIRKALMQVGQKLAKHIKREAKAAELAQKMRHIEQFCPILINGLISITKSSEARKKRVEKGLLVVLGKDTLETKTE